MGVAHNPEQEGAGVFSCRVCWELEESQDNLISPCKCAGEPHRRMPRLGSPFRQTQKGCLSGT